MNIDARINELEKKIAFLEKEKTKWEKIAMGLDARIKEIKSTWKSPWDQVVDRTNVSVNVSSSIPVNKIVKAKPEEMTDEELDACLTEYSKRLNKTT